MLKMMLRSIILSILVLNSCPVLGQQVILKSEFKNRFGPDMSVNSTTDSNRKVDLKPFEPKQFKSLNKSIIERDHEVVMVGKVAPEGLNIYEIALFGNYQKTMAQLEEDRIFIQDADRNFENREKASYFFSDMGWQYLSEGSKKMATFRYNLAHLLNPDNVDVFWGLGVIAYQKEEFEEAVKLMSMGLDAGGTTNVTLLVDLATVYIKCFSENHHNTDLPKAYDLLHLAIKLKPDFGNAYMQLSLANLVNGKPNEAWINFHKGYEVSPLNADFELLSKLLKAKPDPMGVFN
ncbi:MAG: tetratricopeptide (TPR) repeat protein [Arcticibacterium sp.]|jgi:tetratricopeptide (TPR) repeat protein